MVRHVELIVLTSLLMEAYFQQGNLESDRSPPMAPALQRGSREPTLLRQRMNSRARNGKKILAHFQARWSVKTPYPRWSVGMMGSTQEPDEPKLEVNAKGQN